MSVHLGYYAHHHGSGHVRRAEQVLARCRTSHTLLTSSELADGPDVIRLPLDARGRSTERPLPAVLHHAPIGHRGLRERTATIAAWLDRADPAVLVVDVSVEVTLLARLAGVLPVVVRQHGDRNDPAHRAAYDAAGAVIAFWPAWAEDPSASDELRDRTCYLGATARLEGRALPREVACERAELDPSQRQVVVLQGFGGAGFTRDRLVEAAQATPDHRWTVLGGPLGPAGGLGAGHRWLDERGVVDDPVALLSAADVIVSQGGQNAISDAAAVGARLVVLPQPRPFDEQVHLAEILAAQGCAVVRSSWPYGEQWPGVLAAADELDRGRLRSYVTDGAATAARASPRPFACSSGEVASLHTSGDDDAAPPRAPPACPVARPSSVACNLTRK